MMLLLLVFLLEAVGVAGLALVITVVGVAVIGGRIVVVVGSNGGNVFLLQSVGDFSCGV